MAVKRRVTKKTGLKERIENNKRIQAKIAELQAEKKELGLGQLTTWENKQGKKYLLYKTESMYKATMLDRKAIEELHDNYETIVNAMDELEIN